MVQNQKAHFVAQGLVRGEQPLAALELVEHARAHFRVTEKMHFAAGRDGACAHLTDVMEERGVTHLDALHALGHDLLGVLPDVLVPPFTVAEADQSFDLGQQRIEHAADQQRIEPVVRVLAEQHAVEVRADISRAERIEIRGADQGDWPVRFPALGTENRALERSIARAASAAGATDSCGIDPRPEKGASLYSGNARAQEQSEVSTCRACLYSSGVL